MADLESRKHGSNGGDGDDGDLNTTGTAPRGELERLKNLVQGLEKRNQSKDAVRISWHGVWSLSRMLNHRPTLTWKRWRCKPVGPSGLKSPLSRPFHDLLFGGMRGLIAKLTRIMLFMHGQSPSMSNSFFMVSLLLPQEITNLSARLEEVRLKESSLGQSSHEKMQVLCCHRPVSIIRTYRLQSVNWLSTKFHHLQIVWRRENNRDFSRFADMFVERGLRSYHNNECQVRETNGRNVFDSQKNVSRTILRLNKEDIFLKGIWFGVAVLKRSYCTNRCSNLIPM